ncbi:MAG: hypothetical protein V1678_04090 [Candidatus Aenigmatarchaeota archaeon]
MADIDILQILFNTFLRINPSTIYQYTTPQTQILNLFLIPHVILFLFIYGFSWVIIPTHKGLKYLISITAYLTIVLMGEPYSYYSLILPFISIWWQISLFVGFFFFIWSRFIHPSKTPEIFNIGRAVAHKITDKEKNKKAIEQEIDSIKGQIAILNAEANNPGIQPAAQAYIQSQISNLKAKKRDFESRL